MTNEELEQILGPRSNTRAAWCLFDHEWYLQAYPDVRAALADDAFETVRQFYLDHGRTLLHAPNMFFDERWYLQRYPDVAEEVMHGDYGSGYEQYCSLGYLARSPHFLYDDDIYVQSSRDLTDQAMVELDCFNRYDHYIKAGAAELRPAHLLFDPAVYRASIEAEGEGGLPIDAAGPFEHFLQRVWYERLDARTSIYFDQAWYLDRYADAREAIAAGEHVCAVQHYLTAPDPGARDPLPQFSEIFYQDRYPRRRRGGPRRRLPVRLRSFPQVRRVRPARPRPRHRPCPLRRAPPHAVARPRRRRGARRLRPSAAARQRRGGPGRGPGAVRPRPDRLPRLPHRGAWLVLLRLGGAGTRGP